ncbi:hypothetical protein [Anaerocolumna chitinilytica]|uniref:Uncharacterized protein n=1 Tax=Anaerocolumna chitinilytica TaxID=1727145 RepID=A0A7I8DIA5_9FIRM|nr:hypothetical protein [Anaerocolumna chitinilytica]BCJ98080.1 hypothetical protein bsdcttw_11210 [Anaerocolumna chitinilytica]
MRIFLKLEDNYVNWEELEKEKQMEFGQALNDRSLRAIGYEPVRITPDKTA